MEQAKGSVLGESPTAGVAGELPALRREEVEEVPKEYPPVEEAVELAERKPLEEVEEELAVKRLMGEVVEELPEWEHLVEEAVVLME